MPFIETLWWLLCAHALTDYVLQSPEMAKRKQPRPRLFEGPDTVEKSIYGPWWWWMLAHGLINGLGVLYVTQSVPLSMGEVVVHCTLDTLKSLGYLTTNQDQVGHLASKGWWAWLATL